MNSTFLSKEGSEDSEFQFKDNIFASSQFSFYFLHLKKTINTDYLI